MNFSPINVIEESNFHNAWAKAIQYVIKKDHRIVFGSLLEPKSAIDSCQMIVLDRTAIKQVENREIHPQSTFKAIDQYCNEFTRRFVKEQREMDDMNPRKHPYTYMDRLINYPTNCDNEYDEDQIKTIRNKIKQQQLSKIQTNQMQAITWMPFDDNRTQSPPCLQRMWMRWYPGDNIDLHLEWRSRDLYNAWQSNIIAITDMLNREIMQPTSCTIERIVDYSDSLHIYEGDMEQAKKINLIWSR